MEMSVRFPQGLVVEAAWKNHVIRTDQPAPFDKEAPEFEIALEHSAP